MGRPLKRTGLALGWSHGVVQIRPLFDRRDRAVIGITLGADVRNDFHSDTEVGCVLAVPNTGTIERVGRV